MELHHVFPLYNLCCVQFPAEMMPGKNLVFIEKSPIMTNRNYVLEMMKLVMNVLETWA